VSSNFKHIIRMTSRTLRTIDPAFQVLVQAAATDDLRVMRRHVDAARVNREWLVFIAVKYHSINVLRWLRVRLIRDPLVHADLATLARRYPDPRVLRHLAVAQFNMNISAE
jgi:hypothetical protein